MTDYQPPLICWVSDGVVSIKKMDGEVLEIKLPLDISFAPEKVDYAEKDVIVLIRQAGLILVLRKNRTWSLIEESTRILLNMGSFDLDQKETDNTYEMVGYMSHNNALYPVLLDMKTRKYLHGRLGPEKSNGHDFYLSEEFPLSPDDLDETMSLYFANNEKDPTVKLHLYTASGREVRVRYEHVARNLAF